MEIKISEKAGFCPGVRRADDHLRSLIKELSDGVKIFTLGQLIHNRLYTEELEELGVDSVSIVCSYRFFMSLSATIIIIGAYLSERPI